MLVVLRQGCCRNVTGGSQIKKSRGREEGRAGAKPEDEPEPLLPTFEKCTAVKRRSQIEVN